MRYNLEITFFLICIFSREFLATEAKVIDPCLDQNEMSASNHCYKKLKSLPKTKKLTHLPNQIAFSSEVFTSFAYYSSIIQVTSYSLRVRSPHKISTFINYYYQKLLYLYLDKASPPPQLV